MEQNLKIGNEVNCLVIKNLLEEEEIKEIKEIKEKDFQSNNFMYLSLKNSLIKGLTQKIIDPFFKKNFDLKNAESFETNIVLGIFC